MILAPPIRFEEKCDVVTAYIGLFIVGRIYRALGGQWCWQFLMPPFAMPMPSKLMSWHEAETSLRQKIDDWLEGLLFSPAPSSDFSRAKRVASRASNQNRKD